MAKPAQGGGPDVTQFGSTEIQTKPPIQHHFLETPSWKWALIQNLTTAGHPMLAFMCPAENFTCVLLIYFCKPIKQYLEDPKQTAVC